jgi:hypothetical protein
MEPNVEEICMKQWTKTVIFFIGIILIFSNCKNEGRLFDNFYENEKVNLINTANEILLKLGLENFEVVVYAHRSINNRVIGKNISDTNWNGSGINPEGPYNNNNDVIAFRDMSNLYGYMRQRTATVNYELNAKREISYDYFSIMIIAENVNQRQKAELMKIFDSYILNIERGDTIFIVSKNEFNKLD